MSHQEKTQKPMEPCGTMIAGWSCTQIEPTMSGLSLPLLLYVFLLYVSHHLSGSPEGLCPQHSMAGSHIPGTNGWWTDGLPESQEPSLHYHGKSTT